MNFFEHQDQARQNTLYLIGLFVVAIVCMIAILYLVVAWVWVGRPAWKPELCAIVAAGTIASIGAGSLYKLIALRAGGKVVAEDLGGELIDAMTDDAAEQRLLNIVEEMSIASGIPVPGVYVLRGERGINAFAAGFTPNDAVVGVTRGCLEQLDRDELQGVIAHEFSHILNGDMRLNLRLIGVLQGLLLIHIMGRIVLRGSYYGGRSRSSSDKSDNITLIIGLAMLIVGGIGFIAGRLIKSAVSRQREFLADASAVQFTRNPNGIGDALRKIGGYKSGSEIDTPKAEEASHLFFGEAFTGFFSSFGQGFSTHPPLEERIKRLEGFAGQIAVLEPQNNPSVAPVSTDERMAGFAGNSTSPPPPEPETVSVSPDRVVAGVGTTNLKHLNQVKKFLGELPEPVRMATRNPNGAMAIVYGLLLDSDPQICDRQLELLQQTEPPEIAEQTLALRPHLCRLDARTRLPIVDLTIPALRQISPQQCTHFFKQIKALIKADNQMTLSEYVVFVVLRQRLSNYFFEKRQDKTVKFTQIKTVFPDCILLLSALATVGEDHPDAIANAFCAGLFRLPRATGQTLPKEPVDYTLTQVGESLKRLELASPKLKQGIVDACAYTVLADQKVTLEEAELLRAIVISLNCPIPPFLDAPHGK